MPPGPPLPATVSATGAARPAVVASAGRCDCEWVVELALAQGEESGTVTVDPGDAPFRTSASGGRFYVEPDGGGTWRRYRD